MLNDLVKSRIDDKKPRREGLTFIVDKLQGVDKDNFEILSPMIDVVKIYGAFPLLIPEPILQRKIKFYHDFDVLVSTGSTITEYAIMENSLDRFVAEAAKIGFDVIEIGENSIELSIEQKEKITQIVKSKSNLEYHWKVGRKDPRHQLGVNETLLKIDEAMKIGANKVILEANQGMAVGIYDERGLVKWNFIGALTAKYPPMNFIFEAPLESQQSSLIAEFGQRVNLAEIHIDFVPLVESQRRGFLSKATYGVSAFARKEPEGGPASKFIYYIIKSKHPVEQGELINLTHLPRRTVQNAIEELKQQGLVMEKNSLDDTRRKAYYPIQSD
ncbi:MAG: phosphosulfolactate synthase, partial [Nitrososphaeraceae archaeon]|nr:phosphosulfolactate synthase [Nitrososphaeraceae archaeon]